MTGSTQTFVFTDLVGFTALAELEGDERALQVALELSGPFAASSHNTEPST
jgi:hypothetical protein